MIRSLTPQQATGNALAIAIQRFHKNHPNPGTRAHDEPIVNDLLGCSGLGIYTQDRPGSINRPRKNDNIKPAGESTTTRIADGLDIPPLAEKQKHGRASIVALVTPCKARGLKQRIDYLGMPCFKPAIVLLICLLSFSLFFVSISMLFPHRPITGGVGRRVDGTGWIFQLLVTGLVGTARDFNQMESELCLNRAVDFPHIFLKYDLVKFFNHLARGKLSQVPSLLSRWTLGVDLGQFGKVRSVFNLRLNVFTFLLCTN
jgi:hypothetical protein